MTWISTTPISFSCIELIILFSQFLITVLKSVTQQHFQRESLHLLALKYALGVKNTTQTDAVYAELGLLL